MRAFPLLALILACSFKPETAHPLPGVVVESVFDAKWAGERALFDRNENLLQTASVFWSCRKVDPHRSVCEEELTYRDTGRMSAQRETATSTWQYDYQDQGPVQLSRSAGALTQSGQVRGSLIYVKGTGLIPRSNVTAAVETRIFGADLDGRRLVQVEVYRRYGVELGRAVTNWTRLDNR